MKIQVSELIVRYLEKLGIEYIFGMPGAHILPVYDSLYHSGCGIYGVRLCTCIGRAVGLHHDGGTGRN